MSCGSAQLGGAVPALAQHLAFPGHPAAWLCGILECSANTFLKLFRITQAFVEVAVGQERMWGWEFEGGRVTKLVWSWIANTDHVLL